MPRPAVRARTTAQLVAEAAGFGGEIVIAPDMYLSGAGEYVTQAALHGGDAGRVK